MELLLLGGSGFLGRQMIKVALAKNHQVTYLSRQEGNGSLFRNSNLYYLKGDLLAPSKIDLTGHRFDVLIDCVGAIKPSQLRTLNVHATTGAISICQKYQIGKLVYISANTGYPTYLKSKREAEQLIKKSGLDYLIVKPNLLFGKERLMSIFQAKCLFLLMSFPIFGQFFKRLRPQKVSEVAETVIDTLETSPYRKLLTFNH